GGGGGGGRGMMRDVYAVVTREEVFAYRVVKVDGWRWPRSRPVAVIKNKGQARAETLERGQYVRVKSITAELAMVTAKTVCLHGDGEHELAFARRLRATFA
ncbi:LamB/YcsF family protein, partial [Escherichia coli]|uniref:LamB/YcsF family protein n=1 Tax=Escherichia coli TaxID=562 RepID=UPI001484CC19